MYKLNTFLFQLFYTFLLQENCVYFFLFSLKEVIVKYYQRVSCYTLRILVQLYLQYVVSYICLKCIHYIKQQQTGKGNNDKTSSSGLSDAILFNFRFPGNHVMYAIRKTGICVVTCVYCVYLFSKDISFQSFVILYFYLF